MPSPFSFAVTGTYRRSIFFLTIAALLDYSFAMTINPQTDALLIIDVQNDFLPGGTLAVGDGFAILDPILALLPKFETVVATQDFHPRGHVSFASAFPGGAPFSEVTIPPADKYEVPRKQALWPDHCVAGTEGAEFPIKMKEPLNRAASLILRKGTSPRTDSYSAFRENEDPAGVRPETGLAGYLRSKGIQRVFCVGLAYDFCVAWTARDAVNMGLEAFVIEFCTRAVFPQNNAETKAALERADVVVLSEV